MKKAILLLIIVLIIVVAIILAGLISADYYTAKSDFCGSCHVMKNYYSSWKNSEHGKKDIACVVCHYAAKDKHDDNIQFKGLRRLLMYFPSRGRTARMPTRVSDSSCITSECHPKDKFLTKKIKFTEKISYVHKTHEDEKIEGQKLHCSTCHQNVTAEKHFEATKEICFLCHFKNTKFNEGRARCSLCHEIPTKPLQKQKEEAKSDEKSITHDTLKKAKVPCQSCHYEVVQGKGDVNKQKCFNCHQYSFKLEKKVGEKRLMHTEHVAGQHVAYQLAECVECHEPIRHQELEFMDTVRLNCSACHPDHHKYQSMLLTGNALKEVEDTPSLMLSVKTNCLGCHKSNKIVKGEEVVHGSGKTCAACHTEKHEGMVKEWKEKTGEELKYAKEIEKEALDTIEKTKDKVAKEKLNAATALLKKGQETMQIVEYGGGVHNKKYSIMLLDAAMTNFEDAIDLLNE